MDRDAAQFTRSVFERQQRPSRGHAAGRQEEVHVRSEMGMASTREAGVPLITG
jgi:hypothetical protein